jgi:ABC-type uncharacterized transport system fused permease/ATPase subunit
VSEQGVIINRQMFCEFSLVITQFQAISSYAAVATRLCEFVEYAERCDRERSQG